MRAPPHSAPRSDELLDALSVQLAAGASAADALRILAAVGPSSARAARPIEASLARGLAAALRAAQVIDDAELALVKSAETAGRIESALSWVATRRRVARARRRAILGAVAGPLAFVALTFLSDPLPQMMLGSASFGPALRNVFILAAVTVGFLWGLPRLFARVPKVRQIAASVPLASQLIRMSDESDCAALGAAFARGGELDLGVAQLDPEALSESFRLALTSGERTKDVPARLSILRASLEDNFLARLRLILRVVVYTACTAVAIHSAMKLFSTPLGGDLGNSPEMKELQKELDGILQ